MTRSAVLIALLLATSVAASAEQITMGENPRISTFIRETGITVVNAQSGATGNGEISQVAFRWATFPCISTVRIKFVRITGDTMHLVAERGPFPVPSGALTRVVLDPPVTVQTGDLIGYSGSGPAFCGNVVTTDAPPDRSFYTYFGDLSGDVAVSSLRLTGGSVVPVFGTSDANYSARTDIVPVVASLSGLFGSRFESELQLQASAGASRGRIIYHPELTEGSSADPSIPFEVPAYGSTTFPDVMAALGVTGKGSLDIRTDLGFQPPGITARVFERSPSGTKGFSTDGIRVENVTGDYDSIALVAPSDLTHFRMNIGIRTLDRGATIVFFRSSSSGSYRGAVTHTYGRDFFVQQSLSSLLGSAYQSGDVIVAQITSGDAVIYSSTIDNDTNDPAITVGTDYIH